jgi:predicted transcriptional regulator of viral defense system
MKAEEFIDTLQSDGRYSFTSAEAEKALAVNRMATLNALHRLIKNNRLVSPVNGFYLVLNPQYHAYGCLPADMFIDDLMKYFNLPYYVGFLSAAQWYGAAHQKPQRFQVVTSRPRRPIHCGRIFIQFIASKAVETIPTKLFNTFTGTMKVATPETLAKDIVSFSKYTAGISNSATILLELAEQIDSNKLIEFSKINSEVVWIQRLGYLSEFLNLPKLSNTLEKILKGKKPCWVQLVPSTTSSVLERNNKWKIMVNTQIEPDDI